MKKYYDFAAHSAKVKDLGYYRQRFIIHPKRLLALKLPLTLSWQKIRFAPANVEAIVEKPGVYALIIQHETNALPPHGYILYFGQTGAPKKKDAKGNKVRTLRDRYKDYLRDKIRPKRM